MGEKSIVKKDLDNNKVSEVQPTDSPAQIREKIEETRGEMSETIDALQEKLSVENISEQVSEKVSEKASEFYETAKDTVSEKAEEVYDATIGKAGEFMQKATREIKRSGILDTIAENPLPLLLIATGAGLLFFTGKNKRKTVNYRNYRRLNQPSGRRTAAGASYMGNAADRIGDTANSAYNKAGDAASSAYDAAGDATSSAYDAAGNAVGTTYDAAGNAVSATYDKAGNAVSATYDAAGNLVNSAYRVTTDAAETTMKTAGELSDMAREQYDYYIDENPLVIGAVALVAGALVGLAIPTTYYENRLVGEKRDNLLAQAKDTAQNTYEKVKEVAGQAVTAVTEEAKNKVEKVKNEVSEDQSKDKSSNSKTA